MPVYFFSPSCHRCTFVRAAVHRAGAGGPTITSLSVLCCIFLVNSICHISPTQRKEGRKEGGGNCVHLGTIEGESSELRVGAPLCCVIEEPPSWLLSLMQASGMGDKITDTTTGGGQISPKRVSGEPMSVRKSPESKERGGRVLKPGARAGSLPTANGPPPTREVGATLRFSPLCVLKCALETSAQEDANSHFLHLFVFSPMCVVKCLPKLPA